VDRFAYPHIEHDLVELRHFERVLVAEFLDELRHDLVVVELLQSSNVIFWRRLDCARGDSLRAAFLAALGLRALDVGRGVGLFRLLLRGFWRGRLRAAALLALGGLGRLSLLFLSHRSGLRSAWRSGPCGRRPEP